MTVIQGGVTSTGNTPRELEEGINAIIQTDYNQYEKEYDKILDVFGSKKSYETDVPRAGTGYAKVKGEGSAIEYDSIQEGATKRYINTTYALAAAITEEAIEDNLYQDMVPEIGRLLTKSIMHTKEQVAANVFNNGYDSNYVGWDGKSLFANDHKLIKGGTYSNVLPVAADLSEASLEDAIILAEGFTDDSGLIINAKAVSLHVHRANQFNADRILASTLQNDTDNNAINAIKNMGLLPKGYHVNHRFVDPDNWFIRTDVDHGGKFFDRVSMKTGQDNDFNTANYLHKAMTRFSVGWSDARQYVGSGQIG